jgi:DNA-directed RNA polymerase specialized sigma24 family protein
MKSPITRKEYGLAYKNGRRQTENFLLSRGLREDEAQEKAQAAWAKGWERRFQLKDKRKTLSWINTIALNLYRSNFRRDSRREPMRDFPIGPGISFAAFDLERIFKQCRQSEQEILELRYLAGYDTRDLAARYGCTQTAVRVKLLRARRSLRSKYKAAVGNGFENIP